MASVDQSNMAGMDRGPATDANHEFLRKMSDHHQGLIVMMDAAMERASSAGAKADAKKLHAKQHEEQKQMLGMITSAYSETYTPMEMPSSKAMNDSLQQKSGAEYDRDMYRHVIMHHQEGIKMMDEFLPKLTRADLRQMVQKMKADQTREIAEFERRLKGNA